MVDTENLWPLSPALRSDMEAKGIDVGLTLAILDDWNRGLYDSVGPIRAAGVPAVDGERVIDLTGELSYSLPAREAGDRLASFGLEAEAAALPASGNAVLSRADLARIGARLLGRTAYGVLNGGSATSYADRKKNLALGAGEFEALEPAFEALEPLCLGRPKGLTPAYVNPDGSPGASFLALKMRARLLLAAKALPRAGSGASGASAASRGAASAASWGSAAARESAGPFMPLLQMTSVGNDAELAEACGRLAEDPLLAPLAARTGLAPADWATGVQPMIAAYTHSSEGGPKRVFDRAGGKPDCALPLPGGHGQCFRVLAPALRALRDAGARFAYLGNVDNLGCLPDPVEIALLALSGKPAAFDFALRTPVDVKGGILVETEGGGLAVAELGSALPFEEARRLEDGGARILFNCATGLFDLDWLLPRIDELGRRLPVRFSDQDKDAGRYSQAEQNTWEVTRLLPGFLAFAVRKSERFLAAKLLMETLLTSGLGSGDPRISPAVAETSRGLKAGLDALLADAYGLELRSGRWRPVEGA